jgi:hypothetical protein
MAKPLQLFIKPPYPDWTPVHGYGPDLVVPNQFNSHVMLETTGTGTFVAAATGKLSARRPNNGLFDPSEPVTIPAASAPLPAAVNLFLHLSPATMAANTPFNDRTREILGLGGFTYLNVATASLEAGLAELLDQATIPAGSLTRAQVVEQLVRGQLDVPVTVGHVIGAGSSVGAVAGSLRLGFTAICIMGSIDPALVYDHMRDFVEESQPELDEFLDLVPKKWPVIDPNLPIPDVMLATQFFLFSWPVLQNLKTTRALTPAQWRAVGNNQKVLWRERLLKRSGHAPATNTAPPFEFDDEDWQNLFQLEAVVEFYANYTDPWAAGAVPLNPGDAGYQVVDFVDPAGTAAAAAGNIVTLDGNPDLSRVLVFHNFQSGANERRDYLFLATDTARATKMYKITAVDNAAHTVTLDAAPALAGGTSAWEINLRPNCVIIDSFGGRESGTTATAAANVVTLDGPPDLTKINVNFDTIYLPSDTARASRTYRITAVDDAAHTVTLDGPPTLTGGTGGNSSAWHIQAGVSGELPGLVYTLGPGGGRGFDHFDGALFVVFNEEIRIKIRWTSYTSRDYAAGSQFLSSLRGNLRYDFMTYRSGNAFRNYSLRVVDRGASYDGVREARFYYSTPVTEDAVPVGTAPNGGGKTEIRLHYSVFNSAGGGCSSAGCIVSPSYPILRDQLIAVHQLEYEAFNGPGTQDAQMQKASGRTQVQASALWNLGSVAAGLTGANFNDKIVGTFWVIRPDERPL